MSEFSKDKIAEYAGDVANLPHGEKVWFLKLTGHTMEPRRKNVFVALATKIWELEGKGIKPWEKFRLTLEPEPTNPHDPGAVKVMLWQPPTDATSEWRSVHIGYVPRQERGRGTTNHNMAMLSFLKRGLIIKETFQGPPGCKPLETLKVRFVHVFWDPHKEYGSAHLAVHTVFTDEKLPDGCLSIQSAGRRPEKSASTLGTGAPAPVVSSNSYPNPKVIDQLISLHREFVDYFTLEEEDGVLMPAFMSQWDPGLTPFQRFANKDDLEAKAAKTRYNLPVSVVDLEQVEKEYGVTMAENFYRFSGLFEGPVTKDHARKVLETMTEVMMTLRKFRRHGN